MNKNGKFPQLLIPNLFPVVTFFFHLLTPKSKSAKLSYVLIHSLVISSQSLHVALFTNLVKRYHRAWHAITNFIFLSAITSLCTLSYLCHFHFICPFKSPTMNILSLLYFLHYFPKSIFCDTTKIMFW